MKKMILFSLISVTVLIFGFSLEVLSRRTAEITGHNVMPNATGGCALSVSTSHAEGLWLGASLRINGRIVDLPPHRISSTNQKVWLFEYSNGEYRVSIWEGFDGAYMTGKRLADTGWCNFRCR